MNKCQKIEKKWQKLSKSAEVHDAKTLQESPLHLEIIQ